MTQRKAAISEGTYVELVRSLYRTALPTMIMSLSFVGVGLLIVDRSPKPTLMLLLLFGSVAAVARIVVTIAYRLQAAQERISQDRAWYLERIFLVPYLAFAVLLGAFCAESIAGGAVELDAAVAALLFGYCAGVVAGLSLRPWISVPSILAATAPTSVVLLYLPDAPHRAVGLLIIVFAAGGIQSLLSRYHATVAEITMRRSFATLARRDYLTGLHNRFSLKERYDEFVRAAGSGEIVAVHCLDLDRFKPVNDKYGHPAGDAVLRMVADRLLLAMRDSDFAARTGGDEFVVVQTQARRPEEVLALALRVARALAEPYVVDGATIEIGTSVGYVLSSTHGFEFDDLVANADRALCEVKRTGGGVRQCLDLPEADQTAEGSVMVQCDPIASSARQIAEV